MKLVFFHRNIHAGYSINKVTQTVVRNYQDKKEFYVPYKGASLKSIIGNLVFVLRHRDKNVINHITGDIHYCILALIGCKSVLTIHDTVTLDFNELSCIKKLLIEWFWFRLPLLFATKVVCISEQTKHSVEKYTNRKDIVVINNAVDSLFKEMPPKMNMGDKPCVLLIGTNPNKNILRTFEALQGLKCHVVIIGELFQEQYASLLKNNIEYECKSGLSDEQIIEEYVKCDIVSFISLFEGFGMIVLEANKVGRPVICSDIPVLRDVGGDAVLFVNPEDVNDIRSGFKKLFSDDILRKQLIQNGFENAKRFDIKIILEQWMKLYDSMS